MSAILQKIIDDPSITKYEDPEFSHKSKETIGFEINCEWKRPEEFMNGQPKLFHDGISVNDIVQGKLGDCYFLGSLAAIAERPCRIMSFFRNHIDNNKGAYCVTFFYNGVETDVIVDDFFPVIWNQAGKVVPAFSSCVGPELWVLLLEKAYAKLHGSYAAIEGGNPGVALADLTGGPSYMYKVNEVPRERLWDILMVNDKHVNVMCCNVPETLTDVQKKVGLIPGHAYSLLDVREYKGNQLVHVRNPWGQIEWNGAWSDNDTAHWTADALSALKHSANDYDGTFWMPFADFCTYFESVVVNVVEDGWGVATASKFTLSKKISHFEFCLGEASEIYLTMRIPRDDVGVRACVVSKNPPHIPFGGTSDAYTGSAVVSTELLQLPAGEYYVVVEVFPAHVQTMLPLDVNLSFYCSGDSIEFSSAASVPNLGSSCAFVVPKFKDTYGTCEMCGCALTPAHANIQGKKYHPSCLLCYFCGVSLGSSVFLNSGHLACRSCASNPNGIRQQPYFGEEIKKEIARRIEDGKKAYRNKCLSVLAEVSETSQSRGSFKKLGRSQLRVVFNAVKAEDQEEITIEELPTLLDALGFQRPKDELVHKLQMQMFLAGADEDGNKCLSFKEVFSMVNSGYLGILNSLGIRLDCCAEVFHSMEDSNGVVNSAETLYKELTDRKLIDKRYSSFKRRLGESQIGFNEFIGYIIHHAS